MIFLINAILCITMTVLFTLYIVNLFSSNKWFCDVMGWHESPKNIGSDGCSLTGTCPRCGKSVMQDSQGNWF